MIPLSLGGKVMSVLKDELLQKINNKTAKVGVVGLGYVGLPLAVEKAKAGYETIGFDVQDQKVEMVNNVKTILETLSIQN